jgi:hypothetical protein
MFNGKAVKVFLCVAGLILCSLLFFSQSWTNPFVFDDVIKIQENVDLRPGSDFWQTLVYPYSESSKSLRNDPSRPLVFLIYRVLFGLANGNPWIFHFFNSLIHGLNAVLVFLLAGVFTKRLFHSESLLSPVLLAAWFLFLPAAVNSALYAYSLSDLMVALFLMSGICFFSKEVEVSIGRSFRVVLLFFCALLTKQVAVIFPFLVLITDVLLRNNLRERRVSYVIFFCLALLYVGVRYFVFGGLGDLEADGPMLSAWEYFGIQGVMIWKYLFFLVAPFHFSIDHAVLPSDFSTLTKIIAWSVVGISGIAAAWAITFASSRNLLRLLSWGWLLFLLSLFPTSSFLPTVDIFVERRAYLPAMAGLVSIGLICSSGFARLNPTVRPVVQLLLGALFF